MERKKIQELEKGKLYIASLEGKDEVMCRSFLNACNNKTVYYLGGKQFQCSDSEGCGRPISIDIPDMRYREADEPGKDLDIIGLDCFPAGFAEEMREKHGNELPTPTSFLAMPENVKIPRAAEALPVIFPDQTAEEHMQSLKDVMELHKFRTGIRERIYHELDEERCAQLNKWGPQTHPCIVPVEESETDIIQGVHQCSHYGLPTEFHAQEACDKAAKDGKCTWGHIFIEEVVEAFAATNVKDRRKELVQAIAVGIAWLEDIDKKAAAKKEGKKTATQVVFGAPPVEKGSLNDNLDVPFTDVKTETGNREHEVEDNES